MKRALIITSYIEYPLDFSRHITADTFIICTDGGYDIAANNGIVPHLLLGDFDSITSEPSSHINIRRFPSRKNSTDLELALMYAVEKGACEAEIIGGMGGRLDHTVANLQIIGSYCTKFNSLIMTDGRNKCFAITGSEDTVHEITPETDSYLSLFSLSEKTEGVTIKNVKYPLKNHTLTGGFPLGVSNEFTQEKALLSIKKGLLLVVISKKFTSPS